MPAVLDAPPVRSLPKGIEEKFAELAAQIRWLRLVRGASWLAVAALACAAAAVALDYSFDLSGQARGLLLAGFLVAAGVAVWRVIVRPQRAGISVQELAAAVEAKYPSLAERLYTVVELSEHADPGNGSPGLIASLTRDTAARTKKLNFFKAAPAGGVTRLAILVGVAFLAAGVAAVTVSGAGERIRRLFLPFYAPRLDLPFKVVASSGDAVAKRGEAVTLSGFLERIKPDAVLPDTATLVCKDAGDDAEKKLPMTGDDKAAFRVTRPAVGDGFTYCIEAGTVRSEWFTVTVVDAVELGDGTTMKLSPPAYAAPAFVETTVPGVREFEGLQFSGVTFAMKFTRPASAAALDWKPSDPNSEVGAFQVPVTLSGDKLAGTAAFDLRADGTLTLVLVGEHNVRTAIPVATKAVVDAPPRFAKVTGVSDKTLDIRPDDALPLEITAEDDIKVESVVFEYTLNGMELPVYTVPLKLKDLGTPRADGTFKFNLTGKAKEGDRVRYRLRAADGRKVSKYDKGPQDVVYPEKGWAELNVTLSARPLAEQDVMARRNRVQEKLKQAAKEAEEAFREAEKLRQDAAGKNGLSVDESVRLEAARAKAKEAARQLDDLARETALTPDLRGLAQDVADVADGALREADAALGKAQADVPPDVRDKALAEAAAKLDAATKKLAKLQEKNDRLAKDRLDRREFEKLAEEQRKLAAEAKEATDPAKIKELERKQADVARRLKDLVAQNDTLQKALDAAATQGARDLAAEAEKLAAEQKAFDAAAKQADAAGRKAEFDKLAEKQKAVDEKAAALAKKSQTAAKLADAAPADADSFGKAKEPLEKQDAVGAMTEQEKAARELDRLADALDRGTNARKDAKEAARQLARLQDELRKRGQDATAPEQRKKLRDEQEALRRAAEKLNVPEKNDELQKLKKDAVDALAEARDAAEQGGRRADEAAMKAADALRKLGEKMPSREQRLKATRDELEKLQREQEQVSREAAEKLKPYEKQPPDAATQKQVAEKMAEAAAKQREIAEKIEKLDAPGLETRRKDAAAAARAAADDLDAGRPQDIPAGQQDAKKQLDRFKQAAAGEKPADELADELAKKQKQVADAADKLKGPPTPEEQKQIGELQREIAGKASTIADPDGAERLQRAKEAVAAAEKAAQKPQDVDELKKKTKEAAKALDELADELAGAEPAGAKLDRLAKEQQERADAAKKDANKPGSPDAAANERKEIERAQDDLGRTRVGEAQQAKKKAMDALDKLKQHPTPDKAPGMQKAAADALKEVADEVKGGKAAGEKKDRTGPQPQPNGDDADGGLPGEAAAKEARDLAKQQREVKDATAKAAEKAGKPEQPGDNKDLAKAAAEQQKVADDAAKLGQEQGGAAAEAAKDAQKAADAAKAGAAGEAREAADKAAEKLDKAAEQGGNTPAGKAAKDLAGKQKDVADKLGKQAGDAGAAAAQRRDRQKELAKDADKVAEGLEKAAGDPNADPQKVDKDALKKAAGEAREAGKQLEKAGRDEANGRKADAEKAREKAAEAMEKAAGDAKAGAGEKPGDAPPDANAKEAGKAAKDAGDAMKGAGKDLGKGDGKKAGEQMEKAAKDLEKAAGELAKANGAEGEPKPGQGDGGEKSGGNTGAGTKTPTADTLPPDLAKYDGKAWGDLPGEVKTKILADIKAKYGDDYARVIKLYFEQLAEKK